jgi:oxaloacetate decarboxylase alpha subunit
MLKGTEYDTGLDTKALLEIASYFREVRKHYSSLESSFLGADTRILLSQVPGGMLSNLESQLKQQGASDKMDEVLKELPEVQKAAGYVPLVTPTSQIVGTQAVFNVLFGRYERMTGEFRDLLVGKYGKLPAAADQDLVKKALQQNNMEEVVTCRPADKIEPEWDKMVKEASENGGNGSVEDVLTYAMFPKVAPKFFKERANGPVDAAKTFAKKEVPSAESSSSSKGGNYTITVNGTPYSVTSNGSGSVSVNGISYSVTVGEANSAPAASVSAPVSAGGVDVKAPVAGTLLKQCFANGTKVTKGQTVIVLESMKMELEVKATVDGTINYSVAAGSQVQNGQVLASIGGVVSAPVVQAAPSAAPVQSAPQSAPVSAGGTKVNAPVAGVFLRTAVAEGSAVKKGDNVAIIESMKMELEIKAPVAGKVHFVAATGSQLTNGQTVAEIN